jgi:hypothetical protein
MPPRVAFCAVTQYSAAELGGNRPAGGVEMMVGSSGSWLLAWIADIQASSE